MKIIILSGAEATCKSTIARDIGSKLNVTYQSKDIIKEALFDSEAHNTWDFSWFESKSKNLFFEKIDELVKLNIDFVIESNFIGEDKKRLQKIVPKDAQVLEIHCYANRLSSFTRAVKRNETKERHPGHHDRRWYPKILFQSSLHSIGINVGAHKPVALNNNVLLIDTTDLHNVNYDTIFKFVL